jgi:hypothetical protein
VKRAVIMARVYGTDRGEMPAMLQTVGGKQRAVLVAPIWTPRV